MTNFQTLAKNELTRRGYVVCAKDETVFWKTFRKQTSLNIEIGSHIPKGVGLIIGILRHDINDLRAKLQLSKHRATCWENEAISFAGRPRFTFEPGVHDPEQLISYFDKWLPEIEKLACLEFVRAYLSYEFVDYRDEEGVGPPVGSHIGFTTPNRVIDAMFEGWSPQDHELLTTFRNVFITRYPDFEQHVLAWVKEHPNGIEREPVTTEKQQWANQQMELSARTGINQWHAEYQADLAFINRHQFLPPVKEDPIVDVTWPDIQRVLKIINYTNNTELQTELEEHFIINYHGFDTIFDPNGLIELQPQLDAIRIITKQTKLALVYEDWDHQSFNIGTHTITTNLKPTTPFTFNTKTEGTKQALQAFKTWLETHTQLTLTKFLSGNEEHAHLIHPKHNQQNLIKALKSINIITNYPQ